MAEIHRRRKHKFRINLTELEAKTAIENAKSAGLKMSEYIRRIITSGPVVSYVDSATMYRGRTNDHKDILSVLESKEYNILGIVKESVAAPHGDVDGVPAVINDPKSDVAQEYRKIAKML
ncbi:MAG: hypothetical protein J5712_01205 [Lachnospiraceae bacterium]|nr:hypothetical protein [Lachnospiraceae bacterium]